MAAPLDRRIAARILKSNRIGQLATLVPPISLDSSLATHPGSKGEEARDVSEYGRAGFGEEPEGLPEPVNDSETFHKSV